MNLEKKAERLLAAWESADAALKRFRARNEAILEKAATLETDRAAAHNALRELFDTREGPPAELPPETKTHVWVRSAGFEVQVQYKRGASFYEPAEVPPSVLALHGVVTRVCTEALDKLDADHPERYPELARARRQGAWQKPVVVIRPR